ncbi:MAG TPA: hypothetical protein VM427_07595 [Patescibacteria group bacterium]|nr:hypothetical protein [Patescibacteria group bacterium]
MTSPRSPFAAKPNLAGSAAEVGAADGAGEDVVGVGDEVEGPADPPALGKAVGAMDARDVDGGAVAAGGAVDEAFGAAAWVGAELGTEGCG